MSLSDQINGNWIRSATILVTGSTSGIGLALAERFHGCGAQVIVIGRRQDRLDEIKQKHPSIHTHVADVSTKAGREALYKWAVQTFPKLNVLINNAGVQRALDVTEKEAWEETESEIITNLHAPIHLSLLFIEHLKEQQLPVIVNVTSGLSFVPKADVPVYCATKAALHSFTLSLRYQLSETPIKVIELIPPAVNTDLGGAGKHGFGVPLGTYIDGVFPGLTKLEPEVAFGFSDQLSKIGKEDLAKIFNNLNTPKGANLEFLEAQTKAALKV